MYLTLLPLFSFLRGERWWEVLEKRDRVWCLRERERERNRDRQTDTDRQTDKERQTDRQTARDKRERGGGGGVRGEPDGYGLLVGC